MFYRLATILDRESHSLDRTETIDIDVKDPIAKFSIIWQPVNGSQIHADGHPAQGLSKIELIDGSDVLYSLTGPQAQAAAYYSKKKEPPGGINYLNGMSSFVVVDMCFGRNLHDDQLAFDPTKFRNPQLKITLDIDAGGSAVEAGYLTILAHLFDQRDVNLIGFLMHKEVKDFTLANASHEYTDLPTDYPYRKLFIRAQRNGFGPDEQIDTVKISEDVDRKIPLNHTINQLLFSFMSDNSPYREAILLPGNETVQYFYCTPGYWPLMTAAGWRTAIGGGDKNCYKGQGGRFQYVQTASGPNACVHVEGWAPHSVIEIPFGRQDVIEDWYDVTTIGNLKLDIKGGASVGSSQTCQLFLQQLRKY